MLPPKEEQANGERGRRQMSLVKEKLVREDRVNTWAVEQVIVAVIVSKVVGVE